MQIMDFYKIGKFPYQNRRTVYYNRIIKYKMAKVSLACANDRVRGRKSRAWALALKGFGCFIPKGANAK